jgi:hypothetical protein
MKRKQSGAKASKRPKHRSKLPKILRSLGNQNWPRLTLLWWILTWLRTEKLRFRKQILKWKMKNKKTLKWKRIWLLKISKVELDRLFLLKEKME